MLCILKRTKTNVLFVNLYIFTILCCPNLCAPIHMIFKTLHGGLSTRERVRLLFTHYRTKMKMGDTKDCSMQGTVDESETITELPTELTSIQTQRTSKINNEQFI